MVRRSRETFQETLLTVAPHNAQVLENKALTASSLAATCPAYEHILRAIESKALDQMFSILVHIRCIRDARLPDCELVGARLPTD